MTAYALRRPDVSGTFLERLNRFVGIAEINGERVRVHIHDPGRLRELLRPGVRIHAYNKVGGKTRYYLVAVDLGDELVLVNSAIHNDIVAWLVSNGIVLRRYQVVRREPVFGSGRFDLLLRSPSGKEAFMEVKGVTLVDNGVAKFPDPYGQASFLQGRGKVFKLLFATSVVCLLLNRLGLGRILRRS
ncbi:hypothetical protein DDW08_04435 [Vulcanisaeta sp. SCGC AB-777_J10]|nr:hypothetical protein DDW08_04435 [Vulcanisaeta sp. SCGC AB-777_J10]